MKSITLARGISLPMDVVTQTIAIIAKRRVGKSYTARRLAEQIFAAGEQIAIVDPKGDHWGIRSSADGKGPGLPIVILGGEHGDVPLEAGSGEIVAKLVVEERVSVLLDLSLFRKHEIATFMTAFLETLYRLKSREQYRTPLMLLVDEADAIMPQKPQPNEARMLGAGEDIVRRGGQRGIGVALITQRSAVLNKNVLTQAEMLIALRTIAPQDRAALEAWIEVHGTDEQRAVLMESLASLPKGEAWFWSPGWPTEDGIFTRAKVLPITTFDSGKSPEAGETRHAPKKVADVDLGALTRQMAATIERAKADDPKMLRGEIARLTKELATANKMSAKVPAIAADTKAVRKEQLDAAFERGRRAESKRWQPVVNALTRGSNTVLQTGRDMIALGDALMIEIAKARELTIADDAAAPGKPDRIRMASIPASEIIRNTSTSVAASQFAQRTSDDSDGPIGAGEKKILAVIAQTHGGATREQIGVVTGYKKTSRVVYLRRLRAAGMIEEEGDRFFATPSGIGALGKNFEPLPTGAALLDHWLGKLPEGEAKILRIIAAAYPNAVDRETIGDQTGYKKTSRVVYVRRLAARQLVTVLRDGIVASDLLFDK